MSERLTTFDKAMADACDAALCDPRQAARIAQELVAIKADPNHWYVSIFGQVWEGRRLSLYDAYAFLRCRLLEPFLYVCRVDLGVEPGPDSAREHNSAPLKDHPWIEGEFWGGKGAGEDGFVKIIRDGMLLNYFGDNGKTTRKVKVGEGFPLEVGTQSFSKTFYQLVMGGTLARWPYGSRDMTLIWCDVKKFNASRPTSRPSEGIGI